MRLDSSLFFSWLFTRLQLMWQIDFGKNTITIITAQQRGDPLLRFPAPPPVDKYGACLHATSRQFQACFCFTFFFRSDFLHRYSTFVRFLSVSLALSLVVVPLYCFAFPLILYGFFFSFFLPSFIVGGTQSKCLKNENKKKSTKQL